MVVKRILKMAILMVNGCHDYKDKLWLGISLENIIRFSSGRNSFKVFVWNHNHENENVTTYLESFSDSVEVLDEIVFDLKNYDPENQHILDIKYNTFAGGYHVHRTPLQILYEYAITNFDIEIIFTFDSDASPIRPFWDIPLVYVFDHGMELAGIWRDELKQIIPPYIHPSCLGIKTNAIRKLGLRFDTNPVAGKQDTLSHFTNAIRDQYGENKIFALRRNNKLQFHPVFNGVYGGLFYHHHFGTRNRKGKAMYLRPYGWKERNEKMSLNRLVMDGSTEMLFSDSTAFFNLLTYGKEYAGYKLYSGYYYSNPSRFRAFRLLQFAREFLNHDIYGCFFILTIIQEELINDRKFLELYIQVCKTIGYSIEADAYEEICSEC